MRSPVFIVGSPRSGTSALVDALLYTGYNGFREGCLMSLIATVNQAVDVHVNTYAYNSEILLSHVDAASLKWRIAQLFAEAQSALNQAPWLDKTCNPGMIMSIPSVHRLWPDGVYIFAKRRGIENIVSRLIKFPAHGFEFHCADWANNMAAWRAARSGLPIGSFIEVEQQDMFCQADEVARELGQLLDLPPAALSRLEQGLRNTRAQQTADGTAGRRLTLSFDRLVESHDRHVRQPMRRRDVGLSLHDG